MHASSKYVSIYEHRNYNGAGYGSKNLVGTSTASAPPKQEMSENYEESSVSSSRIQGFDSRSSSTRSGKLHESSEIRHTGNTFSFFLMVLF